MRSSPCSTSISVRPVSFRIAASRRTRRVSMGSEGPSAIQEKPCCYALGSGLAGETGRRLDGEFIALGAEARNQAVGRQGNIGLMAERLASRQVRQVAFHD